MYRCYQTPFWSIFVHTPLATSSLFDPFKSFSKFPLLRSFVEEVGGVRVGAEERGGTRAGLRKEERR